MESKSASDMKDALSDYDKDLLVFIESFNALRDLCIKYGQKYRSALDVVSITPNLSDCQYQLYEMFAYEYLLRPFHDAIIDNYEKARGFLEFHHQVRDKLGGCFYKAQTRKDWTEMRHFVMREMCNCNICQESGGI